MLKANKSLSDESIDTLYSAPAHKECPYTKNILAIHMMRQNLHFAEKYPYA